MVLVDPIDTIDTERLWEWPERPSDALLLVGHCIDPERVRELEDGTLSDRADR